MEQAEEAAAEAEAERLARVGLERERRVVQVQLLQRVAEIRVVGAVGRDRRPAKTIGFTSLKPGSGSVVGPCDAAAARRADGVGHGVAELHVVDALDVRGDEADLARAELVDGGGEGLEDAHLGDLVVGPRRQEADLVALLQSAVDDADHRRPRRGSCRTRSRR